MLGRSFQQQQEVPQQETIFSTNTTSSQLVLNYFQQMSEQYKKLKTGRGTKHLKLLSGNILGHNQIRFQSNEETEFERKTEQQKKSRRALMENSFFIFETMLENELDTEDDKISEKTRFFYTHDCTSHPNDQLFVVGFIQAYIVFTASFDPKDEPVSIITLQHSQFALCHFNDDRNILVVSASVTVPQHSLKNLVMRMIKCMTMFHGVPSSISDKQSSANIVPCGQDKMKDMGMELTVLFDRFHESPVDLFHPLGYVELASRSNSVFLSAVHLLDELLDVFLSLDGKKLEELTTQTVKYLGSCVLYEENILCNQLPEEFVKEAVLFRVMCTNRFIAKTASGTSRAKRSDSNLSEQHTPDNTSSEKRARRSDWTYNCDSDMKTNEVTDDDNIDLSDSDSEEDLQDISNFNTHAMFDMNERIDISRIYPDDTILQQLKNNALRLQTETTISYHQEQISATQQNNGSPEKEIQQPIIRDIIEPELKINNRIVALFIYRCGNTSLASVFEINDTSSAMSIQRELSKLIRSICPNKLHKIDKLISHSTDSDNQPYIIVDRMKVKKPKMSSALNARRQTTSTIINGINNENGRSSILMFNTNDHMITTNNTQENFLERSALVHERIFTKGDNPLPNQDTDKSMSQITKFYLKSGSHVLYSKRIFDTEIIYHQYIQQQQPGNQSNNGKLYEQFRLENLESNVRDAVRKEFHVTML